MANPEAQSGSFRTVCVRTCDGFYFPISYATSPGRFAQDEKTCQRMCPAAEVQLFSYRTTGEDVTQATSTNGQTYSSLPNALKYRQSFDAACSCKRAGQSWAEALGRDDNVEAGDIVVTEDRAKQMSLPPGQKGQPKAQQKGRAPRRPPRRLPRPPRQIPRLRRRPPRLLRLRRAPTAIRSVRCARLGRRSFRRDEETPRLDLK